MTAAGKGRLCVSRQVPATRLHRLACAARIGAKYRKTSILRASAAGESAACAPFSWGKEANRGRVETGLIWLINMGLNMVSQYPYSNPCHFREADDEKRAPAAPS